MTIVSPDPTKRAAVFLDRDGVLNVYLPGDYVKSPGELQLLPGAAQAVRSLNDAGIPVFLISNQQGVAKRLMTEEDLERVNEALRINLAESTGAFIERCYYCPHASAAACDCRKPRAGLILQAVREYDIDLAASVFVGDTETDARAAATAGVGAFVLVLTGKFRSADDYRESTDHVAPDLPAAVAWILARRPAA
jgi:D-glycero-D-manno-heptose 1,7-bisphosphate phosphatase